MEPQKQIQELDDYILAEAIRLINLGRISNIEGKLLSESRGTLLPQNEYNQLRLSIENLFRIEASTRFSNTIIDFEEMCKEYGIDTNEYELDEDMEEIEKMLDKEEDMYF